MRALGFSGLVAVLALLPAAAPVAADSGVAAGGAGSSMTTGVAASGGARGWGSVPDAPLHPPAGGWGPGGWQGTPGALPPGGPVTPGAPPPPVGPGGSGGPAMPPPGRDMGPPPGMHGGGPRGGHWAGHYPRVGRGHVLQRRWMRPNLYVHDWWNYGLGRPGYGQNWLRYYDDALLVDDYGRVLDERYDMDWDRRGGPPPGDDGYERGNYDRGWGRDGPIIVPPPPPGTQPPPVIIHHGGGWGGGETTVVVVQGAPTVTTTTTTTYEDVVVHRGGRTWKHRCWQPKPRCRCK